MFQEYTTKHYNFHYHTNTLAEKEMEKIADHQETGFSYICDCLNVNFKEKIEYWLCRDAGEVGAILEEKFGDNSPCNGCCISETEILAVYNEKVKCIGLHEDAHLVSYKISIPESVFLREGLAMYFDRVWWGIDNQAWAVYYLKNQMCPSICTLLDNDSFYEQKDHITYPIAGAFTLYLVTRYGKEKYLDFYKMYHPEEIFGKPLEAIEKDFYQYLGLFKNDIVIDRQIEKMLNEA